MIEHLESWSVLLLAGVISAGCTSETGIQCDDPERPYHLTLSSVPKDLQTLALRTAGGWETIASRSSQVDVCVGHEYVVGWSCSDDAAPFQYLATIDDTDDVEVGSCSTDRQFVDLTGTIAQAGFVAAKSISVYSTSAPWEFDVQVEPGPNVIAATDSFYELDGSRTNRIVINRVDTRSTSSFHFDLNDGVQLAEVPLVVDGAAPGDTLTSTSELWVEAGRSVMFSQNLGTTTYDLPTAERLDSETQTHTVTAIESGDAFDYYRTGRSPASTVELMQRWSGVTLTPGAPATASWSMIPEGADEVAVVETVVGLARYTRASRGALEATGATGLSFDLTMPGLSAGQMLGANPGLVAASGDYLHSRTSSISKPIR